MKHNARHPQSTSCLVQLGAVEHELASSHFFCRFSALNIESLEDSFVLLAIEALKPQPRRVSWSSAFARWVGTGTFKWRHALARAYFVRFRWAKGCFDTETKPEGERESTWMSSDWFCLSRRTKEKAEVGEMQVWTVGWISVANVTFTRLKHFFAAPGSVPSWGVSRGPSSWQ